MAKRYDFVIVSQQSWDVQIGSNIKNIALEIAKQHRVLFVNRPLDIKTYLKNDSSEKEYIQKRRAAKAQVLSLESINKNLTVHTPKVVLLSINGFPDGRIFDRLNKYNNTLIAKEIKKATVHLEFENQVLINDGEIINGFYLPELLKPAKSLYYYRDNFLAVPFWQKHGTRLQPQLFKSYDGVVCNSDYLKDIAKEDNPKSFFVGQGCDYSVYTSNTSTPEASGKPIIGYVGALNSFRLDLDLLENLAEQNPQWKWVFVGPEDKNFINSKLHALGNVNFEGSKRPEELSAYIKNFDVAINPQKTNEVTIGNYPRKIDEYLYMGKPTVATKTKAMQMFNEHCYLATDVMGYELSIKKALKENSSEKEKARKAFAETHSWENSVNNIYHSIEQL